MKVLHVIPWVSPLRGGPSQIVLDICRDLAAKGVDVTLVTTDDNGAGRLNVPLGKPIQQDGYTILYFARSTRQYTSSLSLARWMWSHVIDYDFVHAHGVFTFAPLISAFCARMRRVPYAITPHGILLSWGLKNRRARAKQISFQMVEEPLLNHANFVHVTSNQEADELREMGVTAPIDVIYLGIDTAYIEQALAKSRADRPYAADKIVFLFMGRFHPIKGLDLLLPAFAQAHRQAPNSLLVLAGEGTDDYNAWLKAEVKRLGLENDVIFPGFLTGDAKWQAIQNCDVFVLPSYSESFGMAVVEAMAASKPVIISNKVAIHDTITEARAGLVVPCESQALAEAIVSMTSDVSQRAQMGVNSRRLVEEKFTLNALVESLRHHYDQAKDLSVGQGEPPP